METDVLIIGSGISGVTAALQLARDGERRIAVITREDDPEESNSAWAQGGIVSRGEDDSAKLLEDDIARAGGGLASPRAARTLARDGPALLDELLVQQAGVEFDRDPSGRWAYGLEGAHSRRRILHVGDTTGRAIMQSLLARLAATPNVTLLTRHTAVDLLTFPHHSRDPLAVYRPPSCHGAYVLEAQRAVVEPIIAQDTILASGGLGQLYQNTTNPPGARGDGLAMAYRAGARVVNAEYVQFHPTALHMPGTTKRLVSEAVRGEGGVLLTPDGEPFMQRYDPIQGDLAPRDVVARAIYTEMLAHEYLHVYLDIASVKPAEFIRTRFPQIHAECLERKIDITKQPIPVVPAAHYFCGGILVDSWGRSTLPGLYAVGEISCTGIHGANRLASTSLLEGLVWGHRAAKAILRQSLSPQVRESQVPAWDDSGLTHEADPALVHTDLQTIRNVMWHYVGLQRNEYRLKRAIRELQRLWLNIEEFYRRAYLTDSLIGLRNIVLNGMIVARAALHNPTSRGCHYREDGRPRSGAAPPDEINKPLPESG